MRFRCLGRGASRLALAAVALSGCRTPAAPGAGRPLAPWVAVARTAGTALVRGLDVAPDGRVAVSLGHRGEVSLGGRTIPGAADRDEAAVLLLAPPAAGAAAPVAAWAIPAAAQPGPVAIGDAEVVVALGGAGTLRVGDADHAVRGDPGAVVVGLGAGDGRPRWTVDLGSTDWVVVADVAALAGGDVAVAGQFAGTLRAGASVVTSAGGSDGFVARLGGGAVRWLVRVGGRQADGVAGVAALGDRVAIAGTFAEAADLRGSELVAVAPDSPAADGFVAALGADGAVAWVHRFASPAEDAVAGIAVTVGGAVAVAATVRGPVQVSDAAGTVTAAGVNDFSGHGSADGLIATWDAAGHLRSSVLVGGADYDGLRGIAAVGDQLVAGGWFSGRITLGGETFVAGGGDDAFLVVLDSQAAVVRGIAVTGDGREDVTAVAAAPGGWAAAIAHTTAARIGDAALPAPADPLGGVAIVFAPR